MPTIRMQDGQGRYWDIDADQKVSMYPAGGGFLVKAPLSAILAMNPVGEEIWMPGYVYLDADDVPTYPCYYKESRLWNGWAMPQLTVEAVIKLIKETSHWNEGTLRFDETLDAVIYTPQGEEPEVYTAEVIVVDGKEVKTYPVGSGSWCWVLYHYEPEHEADPSP